MIATSAATDNQNAKMAKGSTEIQSTDHVRGESTVNSHDVSTMEPEILQLDTTTSVSYSHTSIILITSVTSFDYFSS